jgi:hypothetical protein
MKKKIENTAAAVFLSEALLLLEQLREQFKRSQGTVSNETTVYDLETNLSEHDRENFENIQKEKDLALSLTIENITRIILIIEGILEDLEASRSGNSTVLLIEELCQRTNRIHHPLAKTIESCLEHAKDNLQL